eukprot:Hpha_TRINITY_DN15697_c1_g8::TRINITY_DN15697_c1_g8_i2::g.98867::m.98867
MFGTTCVAQRPHGGGAGMNNLSPHSQFVVSRAAPHPLRLISLILLRRGALLRRLLRGFLRGFLWCDLLTSLRSWFFLLSGLFLLLLRLLLFHNLLVLAEVGVIQRAAGAEADVAEGSQLKRLAKGADFRGLCAKQLTSKVLAVETRGSTGQRAPRAVEDLEKLEVLLLPLIHDLGPRRRGRGRTVHLHLRVFVLELLLHLLLYFLQLSVPLRHYLLPILLRQPLVLDLPLLPQHTLLLETALLVVLLHLIPLPLPLEGLLPNHLLLLSTYLLLNPLLLENRNKLKAKVALDPFIEGVDGLAELRILALRLRVGALLAERRDGLDVGGDRCGVALFRFHNLPRLHNLPLFDPLLGLLLLLLPRLGRLLLHRLLLCRLFLRRRLLLLGHLNLHLLL